MGKQLNSKIKSGKSKSNRILIAFTCFIFAFFLLYCLISAKNTGIAGEAFYAIMIATFGAASYFIPVIIFWFGILYFKTSAQLRTQLDLIWAVLTTISVSVFFSLLNKALLIKVSDGGWIGNVMYPFFYELLGGYASAGILILAVFFLATRFFRISIRNVISFFWVSLIEDIKAWRENRAKKKYEKAQIVQNPKKEEKKQPKEFANDIKPKIIEAEKKPVNPAEPVKAHAKNTVQEKIDSNTFPYILPPADLLRSSGDVNVVLSESELHQRAELLRKTLADFDIESNVKDIIPGPVVTRYDIVLAPGIKIQSVLNIIDNISLAMKTSAIRIVPIPEKSAVGVEIPNLKSSLVGLRGILEDIEFVSAKSLLSLALGTTTDGKGFVSDLAKMPHLLIAGSTGSGKSVGIHSIILSILYKARPDEVKFMLIDPKRVEMTAYKDLPHLYDPCCMAEDADIITQPKNASASLKRLVTVMEDRYEQYAKQMVRNIEDYNIKMQETAGEKDYYIVVIIDELADLMLIASKEVEDSIQRLAQMARAVGIHLILATQRPSVNVITGVIKANFPARLSFQTTSKIDSRVILDAMGAENLIGKGDMLFLPPGEARPIRLQGAFVSAKEAEKVVTFITDQNFPRIYEPLVVEAAQNNLGIENDKASKDLIPALMLIKERRRISQDLLKANFGSSARATNILSILEMKEFISKPEGTNRWEINFDKIDDFLSQNQNVSGD